MALSDYDFELPESAIAQVPSDRRDDSKLLVCPRLGDRALPFGHATFNQLPEILRPGDCLVMNDSRVIPARLFGRSKEGREFEVFLLETLEGELVWKCLARPGKKVRGTTEVCFAQGVSGFLERMHEGEFKISFQAIAEHDFPTWLDTHGHTPLPPYVTRVADAHDKERYQTVYAANRGSVAAPTAGLHFTDALLERLAERGIEQHKVTLHVGYGTFQPLDEVILNSGVLHAENYRVSEATWTAVTKARAEGRRVVAVGTTSLRALESVAQGGLSGRTRLFISPGYRFQVVDGLITNFHLPVSSLYVLVASLLGLENTRRAYQAALQSGYRFYSYGDAMLVL